MMLVDTHAHIYLDQFKDDLDDVITRAREAGVRNIIMPAIDLESIRQALELCDRYEGLFVMAALHPSETRDAADADFDAVNDFCDNPRVVAVGETGLDYHWDRSFDERQRESLRRHARMAAEKDLPLVLHNREASEDLVSILREEKGRLQEPARLRGVFHCFGGTPDFASSVMDLGFHVGLGGTLTFKNGGVPDAIARIPMERIVLETDAPFLSPVPFRGKRNEPARVRLVAEKLAEVRQLPLEEVERITTGNAIKLFGLGE